VLDSQFTHVKNTRQLFMALAIPAGCLLLLAPMHSAIWPATAQQQASTNQDSDRVERYSISGKSAQAWWSMETEEEIYSDVFLAIADSASKGDEKYTESYLFIAITQYKQVEVCDLYYGEEYCYYDHDWLMEFFGSTELDKSAFVISNNLRSASVQDLELIGYDYTSQNEMTIFIDADWTGVGETTRSRDFYNDNWESFKFTFKSMGVSRDADATVNITGDIEILADNSVDEEANLSKIREGTILRFTGKPDSNTPGSGGTNGWKSLIGPIEDLQRNLADLEEEVEFLQERVAELEEQIDGGGSSSQGIRVQVDDLDPEPEDTITISGVIDDADEGDEVDITIYAPGGGSDAADTEVDDDGEFEVTYDIPSGADDGIYVIEVEFGSEDSGFAYFLIDEEDDNVQVVTDEDSYEPGDDVEITGEVIDPVTGEEEVDIMVLDPEGNDIGPGTIDIESSDEFEETVQLDSDAHAGVYAVIVEYDGDEAGWAIFEVEVDGNSGNSLITASLADTTVAPGDDVEITGSIDEDDVEVGEEVFLVVEGPDGDEIDVLEDSVEPEIGGDFDFSFALDNDADTGTYIVILSYVGHDDKELIFTVTS
jgi:hypothetical protein